MDSQKPGQTLDQGTAYNRKPSEYRAELTEVGHGTPMGELLRRYWHPVGLSSPFVDATLSDGSRLHVVIPDIGRAHWQVNVRKFVVKAEGDVPHGMVEEVAKAIKAVEGTELYMGVGDKPQK